MQGPSSKRGRGLDKWLQSVSNTGALRVRNAALNIARSPASPARPFTSAGIRAGARAGAQAFTARRRRSESVSSIVSPMRESRQQMRIVQARGGKLPTPHQYAWERRLKRTDIPFCTDDESRHEAMAREYQELTEKAGVGASDSYSKVDRARMIRRVVLPVARGRRSGGAAEGKRFEVHGSAGEQGRKTDGCADEVGFSNHEREDDQQDKLAAVRQRNLVAANHLGGRSTSPTPMSWREVGGWGGGRVL